MFCARASVAKARGTRSFVLKQRLGESRLPNDALEGAPPERIVERHRDGDRGPFRLELHDAVASALADCDKSMLFENPADLRA